LDQSGSARARSSPVRAACTAREWGPRESNPAGLCGRRVYSAPRLPYRSRAPNVAESKKPPSGPGGSFALLRLDRQSYASGALPPGPMPLCSTERCWSYDQVASRPQSRWKLANRAAGAWSVNASLLPRRIMTWFLEDEETDPRRLLFHYATRTNKST